MGLLLTQEPTTTLSEAYLKIHFLGRFIVVSSIGKLSTSVIQLFKARPKYCLCNTFLWTCLSAKVLNRTEDYYRTSLDYLINR